MALRSRLFSILLVSICAQACATRPVYRSSGPPRSPVASDPVSRQGSIPSGKSEASAPKPVMEEARIKEQDLREGRSPAPERAKDRDSVSTLGSEAAPLRDDSSLLAKITPRTSPQRAASLRVTEEGRKLLEAKDYTRALARLEKTIAIDSTNPYGYYYLAKAHYHLSHYRESLNFLDVAESLVGDEAFWLAEVFALKGENFRALGFLQKADSSYSHALRLNSGSRLASEGLNRLRTENQPSSY